MPILLNINSKMIINVIPPTICHAQNFHPVRPSCHLRNLDFLAHLYRPNLVLILFAHQPMSNRLPNAINSFLISYSLPSQSPSFSLNVQKDLPLVFSFGKSNAIDLILPLSSVHVSVLIKLEGILAGSELVVHSSEK
jgi:hypothetical protein